MPIEINSSSIICSKCGKAYGRRKGYFPVNYGQLYKGIGYLTVCKECVDSLYNSYLSQCHDPRLSVRQTCRKLDIFWSDKVYELADSKNTSSTIMTGYLAKLNTVRFSGKSYDDTIAAEGTLWQFDPIVTPSRPDADRTTATNTVADTHDISADVVAFWGAGYTPAMYQDLEQRREYWMSRLPEDIDLDAGTEALIRQICNLEIDINRDRIAGKPIEKSVNALNSLLGSANLKPNQKKDDADPSLSNTPLGVWLWRYENERPLPEVDDDLKDVNKLMKYIFTWMGHLCKMLNIKNGFTRLYEKKISELRVERPEYEDEDDETLLIDSLSEEGESCSE